MPQPPNDPLFILAPPRSFTSVICAMIGQHPAMYALPEVNLFAADNYRDLGQIYRLRPGFRHGLLRAVAELGLGGQMEDNVTIARKWLKENDDTDVGMIYRDLADWASPKRLVDKSPIYVYAAGALQRIRRVFPQAYFLHLIRHPRATCESIYKLREVVKAGREQIDGPEKARRRRLTQHRPLAEVDDPDSIWLEPHLRILDLLDQVPDSQKMQVKGEDFMADPDAGLADVAAWLGIRTDAEAIEAMKHPERSPYASYGPPNARFGNDPGYLEQPELRAYKRTDVSLDGPLAGSNGIVLSDDVKECAACFGYA